MSVSGVRIGDQGSAVLLPLLDRGALAGAGRGELRGVARDGLLLGAAVLVGAARAGGVARVGAVLAGAAALVLSGADLGAVERACLVSASNCSNHRSCQLGSVRRRSAPPVVGRDSITLNPFACRTDSGMYPDPVSMPSPPLVRVEPGYPAS